MSFNENSQLDTSQVESGGRGGGMSPGGMVIGGGGGLGIIGLIIYLLMQFLGGGSPGAITQDQGTTGTTGQDSALSRCKTGADANTDTECRIVGTVNSVQAYWKGYFPTHLNGQYTNAKTVIYSGSTQSACGTASNQVGPFYCPSDTKVYIDASFYDELQSRFGSSGGPLAQEYVVAHEYGHHVENQLGLLEKGQQMGSQGANSGSVRIELMADCLAGMWAKSASETKDANGQTFLAPITEADIKDALSAAAAVGDDHIQSSMQGSVNPDSWTHGSSEARQRWFLTGFKYGDINKCNTFAVQRVE